jgi:hypothetical protein
VRRRAVKKRDVGIRESMSKGIVNTARAAKRRRVVKDIQIPSLPYPREKKRPFRKEGWILMTQRIFG